MKVALVNNAKHTALFYLRKPKLFHSHFALLKRKNHAEYHFKLLTSNYLGQSHLELHLEPRRAGLRRGLGVLKRVQAVADDLQLSVQVRAVALHAVLLRLCRVRALLQWLVSPTVGKVGA